MTKYASIYHGSLQHFVIESCNANTAVIHLECNERDVVLW